MNTRSHTVLSTCFGLVAAVAVTGAGLVVADAARAQAPGTSLARLPAANSAGASTSTAEQIRVERMLEQEVDVTIPQNTPLQQALSRIIEGKGLRIAIAKDTLAFLPDGLNTTVSGRLRNLSTRKALEAVLAPLGLEFSLRDADILISPSALLERMNRRLSWRESQTLKVLASNRWGSSPVEAIQRKYDTADEPLPASRFSAAMLDTTAPTAIGQLDEATQKLGWVWRVDDDAILLTSQQVQYRRDLELTSVLASYNREALPRIVSDLAQRAGVPVHIEPGVYARLPKNAQESFTLNARNASVRAALDEISGTTGLEFRVENDGLHVLAGAMLNPASAAQRERVIGVLQIRLDDGRMMSVPVRESDVPAPVAAEIERRRQDSISQLVRDLTPPATAAGSSEDDEP